MAEEMTESAEMHRVYRLSKTLDGFLTAAVEIVFE